MEFCTELVVAAVFFVSTLYDVTIFVITPWTLSSIKLTTRQMEMLKVDKKGEMFQYNTIIQITNIIDN